MTERADASASVPVAASDQVPDPPAASRSAQQRGLRWELIAFCELAALCGFVITQPVFDVVGRSPEFFVFHRVGTLEILLWLAAVVVVPPVTLWGVTAVTRLAGARVRYATHVAVLTGLLCVLAVEVGKLLSPVRGVVLIVAAVVAAAVAVAAYQKLSAVRSFLRVAAAGPVAFAMVFVFLSPTSALIFGGERAGTAPARVVGPHPPIVVVLLDEFPLVSLLDENGRVDAKRFPNFAALANQSTWYRNATGVSGFTPYAVPALLTGRYPTKKVAPHYVAYPDNLFSLLSQVYDVRAYETVTQLCRPRQCGPTNNAPGSGLSGVFRESMDVAWQLVSPFHSDHDPTTGFREPTLRERRDNVTPARTGTTFAFERLGENQPARFTDFAVGLRPTQRPTAHFLHLLLPHAPFHYLPSGTRYNAPAVVAADHSASGLRLTRERHLLQVEYTDRMLGELLRVLRETGLFDEAAIFVTADHGVSFTPGASGRGMDDAQRAAGELMWVPMFVKEPRQQAGRVDDRNWEQVDLLPTIADYAGLEVPWRHDGISGRAPARDRTDKYFFNEIGDRRTVDGTRHFQAVITAAVPPLPPAPLPSLIGKPVDVLTAIDGGPPATVDKAHALQDVKLKGSVLPALIHGTLPRDEPDDTMVAIALNGRIGAVSPTVVDGEVRRFAGLITDESLFRSGANQLELFAVDSGGTQLRRLRINGS